MLVPWSSPQNSVIADLQDTRRPCVFRERAPWIRSAGARVGALFYGADPRRPLSGGRVVKSASRQIIPALTRQLYLPGPLRVPVGFLTIAPLLLVDIRTPVN